MSWTYGRGGGHARIMDNTERGRRAYAYLMGADVEDEQASLRRRAPELYDALVEGGFATIVSDPALSGRDREIATVAMLAAEGGAEPQLAQIGRASCRERVEISVVAVSLKKKKKE